MNSLLRSLAIMLALLLAGESAFAIRNGSTSRDPEGPRRSVVQITGPDGTRCTGTVIAVRLVLTAAHCFQAGPGTYQIRALTPRFRFRVTDAAKVAIHPRFDAAAFEQEKPLNDIALLALATDLPDWMAPVPLARSSTRLGAKEVVLVAGFGMDRDRVTATAGTLRQVRLSMTGEVDARTQTLLLVDGRNRSRSRRAGVCRGDSGGPVFRETDQGYVLIGVISAVIASEQADCGSVTAVTPVAPFLDYITSTAREVGMKVATR